MKTLRTLLAAIGLSLLTACGGGGNDADGGDSGAPISGVISGSVTKGPVRDATVAAHGIEGGQMGAQLASARTDADGNFTLSIGTHAGPVMLQVSAGSYTDEATGASMAMSPGDVMTAALPGVAAGAAHHGIQVTPLTAMAQAMAHRMAGGLTDANITAANTAMGNYFSVADILHVRPMNPLVAGAGASAGDDARNYGMTLAAMSHYALSQNRVNSSSMVTAMMNDASDGVMDGKHGTDHISMPMHGMMGGGRMAATAGTSGLATAMTDFMNSAANASGTTAAHMTELLHKLAHSDGHL